MKRFLCSIFAFLFLFNFALADPLVLLEDYTGSVTESDSEGCTFDYSYRYPQVDEEGEGGNAVNVFFLDQMDYTESFTIPLLQETTEGIDCSVSITYDLTCNNDEFFSVLIRIEKTVSGKEPSVTWKGNSFSRLNPSYGSTTTLPRMLGLLDISENNTWLEDRQTNKANELVWDMVWDMIEKNTENIDFFPDLTRETLTYIFFPEEDFYLDENGEPVFIIQPDEAAPADFGLLRFPILLEDILDEM